ncbi:uncharacterized protein LOC113780165 [Coffea eugenioides]|uniref:uncharacterized protein LOC113780165 n=1 Tax=Coffea eugenioides TaxID=49369 RepID=UPI000F60ED6E|nr:uncharacterized protein LOC113780165 [Coffea eugenioides]
MGCKRKFSSEDEYRLEKNRRDRQRYMKKAVQHKKAALLPIEPQSAETQVLPMTAVPEATEHNLFDVPVRDDFPPKHTVGCSCVDLPMFLLPHNTDIPSTLAASTTDPPSYSTMNEGSNIATSSDFRLGNHRCRTNIPLIERIQSEPSILPSVPECIHCHAKRYYMEPPRFCCASGEIKLAPTKMPGRLVQLYKANTPESKEFRQCVRSYNNMFAFTSLGVHYDKDLSKRNDGIYTFRVQGQIYHFMNSLLPSADDKASSLQLYFYDTEHELANRMAISELQDLDRYGIFLKPDSRLDQCVYNTPTVSQVAAIWSESVLNSTQTSRNIEISTKTGNKKIVKQYYGCYDALQYPLIYARSETGWHPGILRKTKADILELPHQTCSQESLLPLQQCTNMDHIIDAEEQRTLSDKKKEKANYFLSRVKLETSRLEFYRGRQNKLRIEAYQGLVDIFANGERNGANVGKRIILPASFIGGPRDTRRRYMDAMALVQRYGKPDIFLTVTCNPSWPEIKQYLDERDESHNRPDLIARVFRAKIEQLKEDLLKKNLFGQVAAYTYVVEFQKRGLPHAHFLIILKDKWKMYSPEEYDRIVSAR